MAKANSTRARHSADLSQPDLANSVFEKADVRHELFDVLALLESAYWMLDASPFEQEVQEHTKRIVRLAVERSQTAIEGINGAEAACMAMKGGEA